MRSWTRDNDTVTIERLESRPSWLVASAPLATPSRWLLAGVLLLLTLLAVAMTYPQALHMREGVNDHGDPLLNTWALTWVAHELPIAPARIFNGNIFYPERRTLAFSETLLAPALAVAPLHWLGAGRILVYNLVFLSGFVLSGVGAALLVYALTREAGAAIVSGIIFAFLPFRIDHYAHLQLQQTQFIPLTLWALHKVAQSGRIADGLLFGAFFAGQLLSCMYYGVFLIPYVAVVAGALLLRGRLSIARAGFIARVEFLFDMRGLKPRLIALAVAAVMCLVIVSPAGLAYLGARRLVGERGVGELTSGSATIGNFLATSRNNVVYGRWSERFGQPERRLFPGVVAVALAALALWPPLSRARIAYGLGLLLAVDMSLGLNGLTYWFFYKYLLPFRGLRIPARMGMMVGFSLAVLAGFGVARLLQHVRSKANRLLLVAGLSALTLAEYRSVPVNLTAIPSEPPPIYADLLRAKGEISQVIVELPIAAEDPTYMYYSTFHWQSLLNGYSGFFPPSFDKLVDALKMFPTDRGFDALRARGTSYILVHGELMPANRYPALIAALDGRREVKLLARRPWQQAEISLYQLLY